MRDVQSREVSIMCPFVHVGVGVADAWDARCLGLENKKGTLRPGADADLIVLDRQGNVLSTWVKGKEVWKKN